MENWIITIAKWMLVIEVALVIMFVVTNYSIRIRQYFLLKNYPLVIDKIKSYFFEYLSSDTPLSSSRIRFYKRHILDVLKEMGKYDVAEQYKERWSSLRQEISERVIYPIAKNLHLSWRPYKRYYAARYYLTYYKPAYNPVISKLLSDPVLLVALNASRVAYKYESSELINESITVFSKYRKMRQSIYVTLASESNGKVEKIVVDRLCREKDPYIRAFCYQLLVHLPGVEKIAEQIESDLNSEILQLRINALEYAGRNPDYRHVLKRHINDESWQMRAVSADLIGKTLYKPALDDLSPRLADHAWWVRLRAAEALGKFGEDGIAILRAQDPSKDKYAFDAAQQVLSGLEGAQRCP